MWEKQHIIIREDLSLTFTSPQCGRFLSKTEQTFSPCSSFFSTSLAASWILTWPGPAQHTQHKLSHFAVSSSPPALAVSWKLSSLDFDLTSTGQPQTNFLTLRLLLHQLGSSSAPNNAQLWVYYAHISILMHRLVIHATSWCMHTFKVIEIADGHLVHQQKLDWQSSERKTLLAWPHSCLQCWLLKCHFWQLYFKADWSKIHFLSMPLFLLWLKTCRFYLVYTCKEVLSSMYHTVLNQ